MNAQDVQHPTDAPHRTERARPRAVDVAITAMLLTLGTTVGLRLIDPAAIGHGDAVLAIEIATFLIVLTVFGRRRYEDGRR